MKKYNTLEYQQDFLKENGFSWDGKSKMDVFYNKNIVKLDENGKTFNASLDITPIQFRIYAENSAGSATEFNSSFSFYKDLSKEWITKNCETFPRSKPFMLDMLKLKRDAVAREIEKIHPIDKERQTSLNENLQNAMVYLDDLISIVKDNEQEREM